MGHEIIYTDTTNKYNASTSGINGASKGIVQNLSDGVGAVGNALVNWLSTLLPFEKLTKLKNERLSSEQNSNITADQVQTKADQTMTIAVVAIIIVIAVVFFIIKRKK